MTDVSILIVRQPLVDAAAIECSTSKSRVFTGPLHLRLSYSTDLRRKDGRGFGKITPENSRSESICCNAD
jgi:hypothetical protein